MKVNTKNEIWIKTDGTLKSTDQLKEECQSWSFNTWENYLMTLEVVTRESYQCTQYIDRTNVESFVNYIASTSNSKHRPLLRKAIKKAISSFSPMEFKVYRLLFFKDLNPTEVAKELNVKRGTITKYQERIFKKVKEVLVQDKIMLPYEALKSNYNSALTA
jgi:RNA polymerase sigma factor (sigma-70 family)